MAELMLINPRKRRRKSKSKAVRKNPRKRRTMTALQRKYFGNRKHKRNPTVAKKSSKRRRRYAVTAKKSRRYRRNPSGGRFNMQTFSRNTLMPSAIGAAGALGLDILMGFLPLPPAMKVGPMRTVIKIVGAVGVGMLAGTFVKRSTAEQIAAGAITVALYDTLKGVVQTAMPTLSLGEADVFSEYPSLAYANAGQVVGDMGEYNDNIGMYVGEGSDMGEYVEG
jgi:hypothetical protein